VRVDSPAALVMMSGDWARSCIRLRLIVPVAAATLIAGLQITAANDIKIGLVKVSASGPIYIAQERSYFTAEGLHVDFVFFDAAQPIAVGVASGDLDFGVAAMSAGFYSLAGQGALRLVAGQNHGHPGYQDLAYLVSNSAYAGGLTSLKALPGHSLGTTQVGSATYYAVGLLAQKYHFDYEAIRIEPLQAFAAVASAIAGNRVDVGMIAAPIDSPIVQRGDAKRIGWAGEETPYQAGVVLTSAKTADQRLPTVEAFLRAYRKGCSDYHEAFSAPDETRRDGPTAPEILSILTKYTGQPEPQLRAAITHLDAQCGLDTADILNQIAWYKSHNMLKENVDGATLIDKRYVIPLTLK
jgi:NitT/TauT family transport system substrate-binding protein